MTNKFITPCFVRVDNEESKARLISWILDIGNSYREDASGYIISCLGSRYENIHYAIPYSLVENLVDCGDNIELFKALAAMNDDNCREQWFVAKCDINDHGVILWHERDLGLYDEVVEALRDLFRKASVEELINHFKSK